MSKDPTQETEAQAGGVPTSKAKKPRAKAKAAVKQTPALAALQKQIADLQAKVRSGEEAALARVCKAMGVDPSDVASKEAAEPKPEPMIRCFVNYPININGRVFRGHVTVPQSVFYVLQEALGKRRQRLLSEVIGNNWLLVELEGGMGYAPKRVGQVSMGGELMSGMEVAIGG